MTIENEDIDNYFVMAVEPYNLRDSKGNDLLQVFRGQIFKWTQKTIDMDIDGGCLTCSKVIELHTIKGYFHCEEGFKDPEGVDIEYTLPSYIFVETYDTEEDNIVCESWIDELSGKNKDIFTPPHLREEYAAWRKEGPPKAF